MEERRRIEIGKETRKENVKEREERSMSIESEEIEEGNEEIEKENLKRKRGGRNLKRRNHKYVYFYVQQKF